MASSRHWALYATNHHLGTYREHRLSGARLGRFGVYLDRKVSQGWQAKVAVLRVVLSVQIVPSKGDPLIAEQMRVFFPKAELDRGLEDVKRGRTYDGLGKDGLEPPSRSWQPDDPIQPEGWHHDGERWVRNDDGGWFQDRYGYWRYTKPGDIGWRELEGNRGWEYIQGHIEARET